MMKPVDVDEYKDEDYNLVSMISEGKRKQYTCSICKACVEQQYQCKNGHLGCFSCLVQLIYKSGGCPTCKIPLKDSISRNIFYEEMLSNEIVKCPFYLKKKGYHPLYENQCKDMKYSIFIDTHQNQCNFRQVECTSCKKKMMFCQLKSHKLSCENKMVSCKYCLFEVKKDEIVKHYATCREFPIVCECNISVKRRDQFNHKTTECACTVISCPFLEAGCKDQFKKDQLKEHLLKYENHTSFISSMTSTIESLKEKIKILESKKGNNNNSDSKSNNIKNHNEKSNPNGNTNNIISNPCEDGLLNSVLIPVEWFKKNIDWYALNSEGIVQCKFQNSNDLDFKSVKITCNASHHTNDLKRCKYTISLCDVSHKQLASDCGLMDTSFSKSINYLKTSDLVYIRFTIHIIVTNK